MSGALDIAGLIRNEPGVHSTSSLIALSLGDRGSRSAGEILRDFATDGVLAGACVFRGRWYPTHADGEPDFGGVDDRVFEAIRGFGDAGAYRREIIDHRALATLRSDAIGCALGRLQRVGRVACLTPPGDQFPRWAATAVAS